MSKYFITFGGGTFPRKKGRAEWAAVAKRLRLEAPPTGLFDEVIAYMFEDLKSDKDFWGSHSEFIEKSKGCWLGFALWKPYLIGKAMRDMKNGDVLVYADAGCEIGIGINSKERRHLVLPIESCIEAVEKEKVIGTLTGNDEREWTKMDLPLHLGIVDEPYMEKPQRQSGAIFFFVCEETRKLVNDWYSISCNYHLIDDSPSLSKDYEQFTANPSTRKNGTCHRPQAVFSQLTKKYDIFSAEYYHKSWEQPEVTDTLLKYTRCKLPYYRRGKLK